MMSKILLPVFMVGYLFALAYVAAGVTYWTAPMT